MANLLDNVVSNFEQGPIRPPSESKSLLIRVTRNCPWNRCTFCSVYRNAKFSIRKISDIKSDIDLIKHYYNEIKLILDNSNHLDYKKLMLYQETISDKNKEVFIAMLNWYIAGAVSVFLQDANSIITPPSNLKDIIKYIKNNLSWVKRITSYGRSHTIVRIRAKDLRNICLAGLNRIHVGLESGSNKVLKMVNKGCNKRQHIKAGKAIKAAGMQLSEYVMPGLGGRDLSKEHALETADAINQINPDYIRLRTLMISKKSKLYTMCDAKKFKVCSAVELAEELKIFLENLNNITSVIVSDHMFNLFEEINGKLPEDKSYMLSILERFMRLSSREQFIYQVGKRIGVFRYLKDMKNLNKLEHVHNFCHANNINFDNSDARMNIMMNKLI